jgi:hypothetical protein
VSAPPGTAAVLREVQCPLCGGRFPRHEACAAGCPLAGACRTLCCPHCHYRFVEDSIVVGWVGKLLHRGRA